MAACFPYFHQLMEPSRKIRISRSPAPSRQKLLQFYYSVEFFTGNQVSCGHTLNTRRSLKTIGNLWCREGESNPQGTIPADFEFHCGF